MPGLGQNELLSMGQQFSGLPMDTLIGGPLNAAAKANGAMAMTQTKFMLDTCFTKKEILDGNNASLDPKQWNYDPIMISMSLTRQVITPVGASEAKAYADSVSAITIDDTILAADKKTQIESLTRPQAQIEDVTTAFKIPLLTIIPLNSLAVKTADISFEMEVKSSYGEDHSNESSNKMSAEASFEAKINYGIFSASVKGSASTSSENKSSESSHYEKSNSAKYSIGVTAGQLPLPEGVKTIIDAFAGTVEPTTLPVPA